MTDTTAAKLRRLRRNLTTGATVVVASHGAIASHGVADYRRMLELMPRDDAKSPPALLQALPPSNWLRRSPSPFPDLGAAVSRRAGHKTMLRFLDEICRCRLEDPPGAQASYLKTLSEEAGEEFDESLTKADASKRIDALQEQTGRGR